MEPGDVDKIYGPDINHAATTGRPLAAEELAWAHRRHFLPSTNHCADELSMCGFSEMKMEM